MSFTGMTARTGPKISLRSNEPGEYSHRSQGKRRLLAHEGIPRGNIVDDGRCHISLVHIHFAAAYDLAVCPVQESLDTRSMLSGHDPGEGV